MTEPKTYMKSKMESKKKNQIVAETGVGKEVPNEANQEEEKEIQNLVEDTVQHEIEKKIKKEAEKKDKNEELEEVDAAKDEFEAEKLIKKKQQEIEKLNLDIEFLRKKTTRLDEKKKVFANPRSEFCFRIPDAKPQETGRYIKYLSKMVKGIGEKKKLLVSASSFKNIADCFYFKTNIPIVISGTKFRTNAVANFDSFDLIQLRTEKFFDDYDIENIA